MLVLQFDWSVLYTSENMAMKPMSKLEKLIRSLCTSAKYFSLNPTFCSKLSVTSEQWAESRVRSRRTAQTCEPFSGHMLVNAQVQTIEELFGFKTLKQFFSLAHAVGLHGRPITTMIKTAYTHYSEVMKFSSLLPSHAVCFLFILQVALCCGPNVCCELAALQQQWAVFLYNLSL